MGQFQKTVSRKGAKTQRRARKEIEAFNHLRSFFAPLREMLLVNAHSPEFQINPLLAEGRPTNLSCFSRLMTEAGFSLCPHVSQLSDSDSVSNSDDAAC
jgi:hypothetical protein